MNRNLEVLHRGPASAGVLLIAKKHILLVKEKSSDKWGLPKGSIQKGETTGDCWRRELKEETQIDIDRYLYRITWSKVINRYVIYTVKLSIDDKTFDQLKTQESKSEEITQVKWMEINSISRKMFAQFNSTARTAIFDIPDLPLRSFRRE